MALSIASLNSGSNGNCYYIGNSDEAIFVDAGLSCTETEIRMNRLGLPMANVKAIFISHEHSDHVLGLSALVQKYQIPVYINAGTLREVRGKKWRGFTHPVENHVPVAIGNLHITPFPKNHDAREPLSFVVSCLHTTVGIFTDIGQPCEQVARYFRQCHAAFLEANYDADMLQNGRYPYFLKNRIQNGQGHLSNLQALELFKTHRSASLSHLLLAHLSKENNSPELVQALFDAHKGDTEVIVASRYRESGVYQVSCQPPAKAGIPAPAIDTRFLLKKKPSRPKALEQLRLF